MHCTRESLEHFREIRGLIFYRRHPPRFITKSPVRLSVRFPLP